MWQLERQRAAIGREAPLQLAKKRVLLEQLRVEGGRDGRVVEAVRLRRRPSIRRIELWPRLDLDRLVVLERGDVGGLEAVLAHVHAGDVGRLRHVDSAAPREIARLPLAPLQGGRQRLVRLDPVRNLKARR